MKKTKKYSPKKRSPAAAALAQVLFHKRVVPPKKVYDRNREKNRGSDV